MPTHRLPQVATKSVACLAVLLTACAAPTQFKGPNGRTAYALDCHSSLPRCYKTVAELCPSGYDVINTSTGMIVVPLATGGSVGAPTHSLAVECR